MSEKQFVPRRRRAQQRKPKGETPGSPVDATASGVKRWPLAPALAAGLCWAGALALLLLGSLHLERDPLAPQRLLFYVLVLAAGLLTFVPIQRSMELPGLAIQGVGGTALLCYTLAFVPAPNDWLLALPETPVYVLLMTALFWSVSAVALPFIYAAGQRIFQQRARRLDLRRARRQSYEVGTLAACVVALAGLRVLTWVSLLLLVLILVTAELLFLSRVEAEGT
ncbi:MAG: hypothetical protein MI924_00335 [Chloroflexales bacterium]|nr:hypothetical protein [Chloroflexales bacterium]